MISFDKALNMILKEAVPKDETEHVPLDDAFVRILASDIYSDIDLPPFSKALMDGYACRRQDVPGILNIVETVAAGQIPKRALKKNDCCKIMTGAMIPDAATTVIKVEETTLIDEQQVKILKADEETHIAEQGRDLKKGTKLFNKGSLIRRQDIPSLAQLGITSPLVYKQPSLAIISTGDELLEPDQKASPPFIRNINASTLKVLAKSIKIPCKYLGIAKDLKASITGKINGALSSSDVVLVSGGVSMGDYDFVPSVINELGFQLHFKKMAFKPGKPTVFASKEYNSHKKYIIGIPGNPVSTFVVFEYLIKPFLYKLMNHCYKPLEVKMSLAESVRVKKEPRLTIIPVTVKTSKSIVPVNYHGSAHIDAISKTQGFISVLPQETFIEKGTVVNVRFL